MPTRSDWRLSRRLVVAALFLSLGVIGCGGPSERETQNARAFEALLTAVSLRNVKELEKDASLIERRHSSGEMSAVCYEELRQIVDQARSGDWQSAEQKAYAFRTACGESGAYFR